MVACRASSAELTAICTGIEVDSERNVGAATSRERTPTRLSACTEAAVVPGRAEAAFCSCSPR